MSSWKNNEKSFQDYMRPKQSMYRLSTSINKCVNIVIPLHLELLRKHASNIKKFQQLKEWNKIRQEHINATRTVEQLKADLWSLDILRNQILEEDLENFNKLADKSQTDISVTISEFLEISSKVAQYNDIENLESSSSNLVDPINVNGDLQLQKAFASIESETALQEAIEQQAIAAESWDRLVTNLQDLNQTLVSLSNLVHSQHETVNRIENNIESADANVLSGTKHLSKARLYKAYMYPVAGALVGGCIGGPVGLFVGLKAGAAAVALGGIIGFTGGFRMKKKVEHIVELEMDYLKQIRLDYSSSLKSCSLPDLRIVCHENEDGFMSVSKFPKR